MARRMPADPDLLAVHREAMAAKRVVFLAQDAVSRAWSRSKVPPALETLLRKLERHLERARHELEDLDIDIREVMTIDAPLGSSPEPTPAKPHVETTAVCYVCRRRVRAVVPRGGDGSLHVFVRHEHDGRMCEGSRRGTVVDDG